MICLPFVLLPRDILLLPQFLSTTTRVPLQLSISNTFTCFETVFSLALWNFFLRATLKIVIKYKKN